MDCPEASCESAWALLQHRLEEALRNLSFKKPIPIRAEADPDPDVTRRFWI